MLPLGHAHRQPIQRFGDVDLAGQAGVVLGGGGKVQHVLLHHGLRAELGLPRRGDVDMAGGAGATAAAVGVDAGHVVVNRRAHERQADFGVDGVRFAIELNERDLGHVELGLKRWLMGGQAVG